MVGGRTERRSRRRTRAASVVVPLPRSESGGRLDLAAFVPSGRALLLTLGIVVGVVVAYWGARTTSVFAIERVEIEGVGPEVAKEVRAATVALVGHNLLALDTSEVEDKVRALPSIAGVAVDRAFPHTLVVKVAAERPVAVVRQGRSSFLVTAAGKVVREIETGSERAYPRIWLTRDVPVQRGRTLPGGVLPGARALAAVQEAKLRRRVKSVRFADGDLVLVLRRGPELRLGDPTDVFLKLTVAARLLPLLAAGTAYLDVSVPERPVSGLDLNS